MATITTLRNRNINLSVLPFYEDISEQNARKWWTYGRIYPLFCKSDGMIPFFIHTNRDAGQTLPNSFRVILYDKNDVQQGYLTDVSSNIVAINDNGKITLQYAGGSARVPASSNGQYYIKVQMIDTLPDTLYEYVSDIFTFVDDITPYLRIRWWDAHNFDTGNGTIFYEQNYFQNNVYLQAELAKPEYIFEEEGVNRDGYFFPIKQISEKRFRFSFFASEYLLDAMRLIRMSDYIRIQANGKTYQPDTFLITPTWENEGDVASVQAEFEINAIAKKLPTIL